MSTQTTNVAPVQKRVSVVGMAMTTVFHSLSAVNNAAIACDNLTGIAADKSARFREQQSISDMMEHNRLMSELNAQAAELGITLE